MEDVSTSPYQICLVAGIAVSLAVWWRVARKDGRLVLIYVAGLCGAFIGAKFAYVLAEGWLHFGAPDMWLQLATGKSITGALLGGYAAVEIAKKLSGYPAVTGDWFATVAPLGIALGRVGCLLHGCCAGVECAPAWYALRDRAGVARWPAVPLEIAFNVAALAVFFAWRKRSVLQGQHFHVYLTAYGLFRFAHEFARETPRIIGPISGYQLLAIALIALGAIRFWQRRSALTPAASPFA